MPKTEDALKNIFEKAVTDFQEIEWAQREERKQSLEDRRFYSIAGAQWEGQLGEQFQNKPRIEVNKAHLSVIRIINEYRNNRITVDFVSKDGSDAEELADVCDGLYRADEQDSVADEAYDNAFEEAVGGGRGAWRYRAKHEDELDDENDHQRIAIEPIFDADKSVYFDLNAKRQDKSDSMFCYVLTPLTPDAFEEEYGEFGESWQRDDEDNYYDWNTKDAIYIAEYYKVEIKKETIHIYTTLGGSEERYTDSDFEADENLEEHLRAISSKKTGEKKVNRRKVHKYIMSGAKILEDCGFIAGPNIPIVPVYGKRWVIQNIERAMGHVRLVKDSQRLLNTLRSWLLEVTSYTAREKPIFTEEQIAGHETDWANDNVTNNPFLKVNALEDVSGNPMPMGPVGYTKPPIIPPALAALMQISEQDLQDLLGNQQAGEELQANISGKAIELIQNRLDMQTFIYMSNFAKSMRRGGEIWLGMAKELLVEKGRKMKTIGRQKEISQVTLLEPTLDKDGAVITTNDLRDAKFDLVADVGPSSQSQKAATVRSLTGMMQFTEDPQDRSVLASAAMSLMEGEGLADIQEYFRNKLLRIGAAKPTKEEAQEMSEAQDAQEPDANEVYLQSAAQREQAGAEESRTKASLNEATEILTLAKAKETQANEMETLAGIDRDDRQQAIDTREAINQADNTVQPQQMGEQ